VIAVTLEGLGRILAGRRFSEFLGLPENELFEAKGATAYDLGTPAGRYELAKDVSSFANSQGGWLVIGLATERAPDEPVDIVSALELVAETAYPVSMLEGMLQEYVLPRIAGLTISWVAQGAHAPLGVVAIQVPPQPEDTKPFIIAKVVEEGERVKQIVFGYVRRIGADSMPHGADQIRVAMQRGMGSLAQRLSSMDKKLNILLEGGSPPSTTVGPASESVALLEQRLRRIAGN
jgi:hypothetical protein